MKVVDLWNNWIDFCKKPIAYDLARSFMFSLIVYSIIGLGRHYFLGHDARDSHYTGMFIAVMVFFLLAYLYGKKNGWLKDMLEVINSEENK